MFKNKRFIVHYQNGDVKFIDDLYKFVDDKGYYYFDRDCEYFDNHEKLFYKQTDDVSSFHYYGGYYNHVCNYLTGTKFYVYNEQMHMIHPNQILFWYLDIYIEKREKKRKVLKNKSHRRSAHKSWRFRHPKTLNEMRSNSYVCKEDGEPQIRGKRKNLPTLWDDYTAQNSTGWKKSTKRKRQWK